MIKLVKRHTNRACSKLILAERVAYIADASHEDHLNKILGTPRNYNCPDETAEAFIAEVVRLDAGYQKFRAGKRGKRTRRIFEEIVYSSPHFADMTDEELDIAEDMVVKALVPNAAARSNRHKDTKTHRTDFHILLSAKTSDYPPTTTIWGKFGGSGHACIFAAFDMLDDQIARRINEDRESDRHIKSRVQVRHEKAIAAKGIKPTLAEEIAANTTPPVTAENIQAAIEACGHVVPKITDRFVSVIFSGAKRPRRYNLPDLIDAITVAHGDGHHGSDGSPTAPATPTAPTAPPAPATPAIRIRRRRRIRRPPSSPPLR